GAFRVSRRAADERTISHGLKSLHPSRGVNSRRAQRCSTAAKAVASYDTGRQAWNTGPGDSQLWTVRPAYGSKGRRMVGSVAAALRFRAGCSREVPVMAGPGDEIAAGTGDRGHLRASHTDREQVIGTLKAAFVQGRLVKDEFDLRVGQALAPQTY